MIWSLLLQDTVGLPFSVTMVLVILIAGISILLVSGLWWLLLAEEPGQ